MNSWRYVCAVGLVGRQDFALFDQLAAAEPGRLAHAVAHRAYLELGREGVNGLDAHTVQSDRLFEGLAVVLAASVHLRGHVDKLTQRYTAAEVAHDHRVLVDVHDYLFSESHHVFVDSIVEHLLEQHIYAVVAAGAVAELADIHSRAPADVFFPVKRTYLVFSINSLRAGLIIRFFVHNKQRYKKYLHLFSKKSKNEFAGPYNSK